MLLEVQPRNLAGNKLWDLERILRREKSARRFLLAAVMFGAGARAYDLIDYRRSGIDWKRQQLTKGQRETERERERECFRESVS